jgi:PTH1 family peptidyl-tRNA hydrolase
LADIEKSSFSIARLAEKTEIRFKGRQLTLIKPTTFMNLSGKAVAYWMHELKIPRENVLILVDDLALPFGSLRMKPKGSSAGHNGLGNIESILGSSDYPRLRFGIGNDYQKGQQVNYVLSPFKQEEMNQLVPLMDRAIEMIRSFATTGIERTMNQFND